MHDVTCKSDLKPAPSSPPAKPSQEFSPCFAPRVLPFTVSLLAAVLSAAPLFSSACEAQARGAQSGAPDPVAASYVTTEAMVPMRDGVKLHPCDRAAEGVRDEWCAAADPAVAHAVWRERLRERREP